MGRRHRHQSQIGVRLSKAVLRGMMKARHGRIINVGSVVGVERQSRDRPTMPRRRPLLSGFTKSLAQEVGSRNITVNLRRARFHRYRHDTDARRRAARQIDRRGFRSPVWARRDDVAHAVAFLAIPARPISPARRCTSTAACT